MNKNKLLLKTTIFLALSVRVFYMELAKGGSFKIIPVQYLQFFSITDM